MERRRATGRRADRLPASARSARERREYAAAYLLRSGVKLALAASLLVAAAQSFLLARHRAPVSARGLVTVIAAALAAGALLAAARGIGDLRSFRRAARMPVEEPGAPQG